MTSHAGKRFKRTIRVSAALTQILEINRETQAERGERPGDVVVLRISLH